MYAWYIITFIASATFGPMHVTTLGPYQGTREDCLKIAKTYETDMVRAECRTMPDNRYSWNGPFQPVPPIDLLNRGK